MSDTPAEYSRRNLLRIGAGALAVVIGGGAGWLDRRNDPAAVGPMDPATNTVPVPYPDSTTTAPTTAPPTTTESAADLIASLDLEAIAALDPAVAELGHVYLSTHPREADLAMLLDSLPHPGQDPIEAAAGAITGDFRNGRTVSVGGWVLAVSEARAAAVVSLVCSSSRSVGTC